MGEIPKELKLLAEWKKILGLHDWVIVLRTDCNKEEMQIDYADGEVAYEEVSKSAEVRILKEELTKGEIRKFDFEQVLVHELLHLKFALLTKGEDWENDLQLRITHVLIDDLARAFVEVKRKGEKK